VAAPLRRPARLKVPAAPAEPSLQTPDVARGDLAFHQRKQEARVAVTAEEVVVKGAQVRPDLALPGPLHTAPARGVTGPALHERQVPVLVVALEVVGVPAAGVAHTEATIRRSYRTQSWRRSWTSGAVVAS
jgi:hypothetical protein